MSNSVKLDQGYRDIYTIALTGVFLILSVVKLGEIYVVGQVLSLKGLALFTIILLLGFGLYYMLGRVRLQMKFGKKKVSVKIAPFGITKIKFKKRDISDVTFFTTDVITKSSGLFIHFGNRDRIYNFGGNKGMTIELNNKRKFTFFSEHLHDERDDILASIKM